MSSVGNFFFREDAQGLTVLNAGIPGYSARISPEQIRRRQAALANNKRRTRDSCRPLAIHWFGPRPSNELKRTAELWIAVDEFNRRRRGAPGDREDRRADRPALDQAREAEHSRDGSRTARRRIIPVLDVALLASEQKRSLSIANDLVDQPR
jgi:hypothetical protein